MKFVELEHIIGDCDYGYKDEEQKFMVDYTVKIYINKEYIVSIEEKGLAQYKNNCFKYYILTLVNKSFLRISEQDLLLKVLI